MFSVQSCNFDKSTCGFVQDKTDDFNWTRINGSTPSTNTGPSNDHTGNLLGSRPVYMGMIFYLCKYCSNNRPCSNIVTFRQLQPSPIPFELPIKR